MQPINFWSYWFSGVLIGVVIAASLPIYSFRWHMTLHILGAVMFLGNIIVTAAWMILAERAKNASVMHFASKTVSRADLLFTGPGVILILGNGLALAESQWGGWSGFHELSWIVLALILLALSGLVWSGFLLRYQFGMLRLSTEAVESNSPLPPRFYSLLHRWYFWGVIAILLPVFAVYLMAGKPDWW